MYEYLWDGICALALLITVLNASTIVKHRQTLEDLKKNSHGSKVQS